MLDTELEFRFPHVAERLIEFWGHKELRNYIDNLFISNRIKRDGFPTEVAMDLMFLRDVHDRIILPSPCKSQWDILAQIDIEAFTDKDLELDLDLEQVY